MKVLIIGTGDVAKATLLLLAPMLRGLSGSFIDILASGDDSLNRARSLVRDNEDVMAFSEPHVRYRSFESENSWLYDIVIVCSGSTLQTYDSLKTDWENTTNQEWLHFEDSDGKKELEISVRRLEVAIRRTAPPCQLLSQFYDLYSKHGPDHRVGPADLLHFATSRQILEESCERVVERVFEVWEAAAEQGGRIDHIIWITNPTDTGVYNLHDRIEEWRREHPDAAVSKPNIVSMGVHLDSVRFRRFQANAENVDPALLSGFVLGQHGRLSVPFYTTSTIQGRGNHGIKTKEMRDYIGLHSEKADLLDPLGISSEQKKLVKRLIPSTWTSGDPKKEALQYLEQKPTYVRCLLDPVISNLFGATAGATAQATADLVECIVDNRFRRIVSCESMVSFNELFGEAGVTKEERTKLGQIASLSDSEWSKLMQLKIPFGFCAPIDRRTIEIRPLTRYIDEMVPKNYEHEHRQLVGILREKFLVMAVGFHRQCEEKKKKTSQS